SLRRATVEVSVRTLHEPSRWVSPVRTTALLAEAIEAGKALGGGRRSAYSKQQREHEAIYEDKVSCRRTDVDAHSLSQRACGSWPACGAHFRAVSIFRSDERALTRVVEAKF